MLVGGLIRSAYAGYQFKDYEEGCWALYDLNEFLKGFGGYEKDKINGKLYAKMAIDDMPPPKAFTTGIHDKFTPESDFISYRRKYAGLLMKAVGIYQRAMIDAVKGV